MKKALKDISLLQNIPLPPDNFNKEELKKRLEQIPKKSGIKLPSIFTRFYLIPLIIFVLTLGSNLYIFLVTKVNLLLAIMTLLISIPLFLGTCIFLGIRFLYDYRLINGIVIEKLSRNYIIANFFRNQKRILKVICNIDKDGKSFVFSDGRYIVDSETIWLDDDKNPNAYYLFGLPNPLKFNFETYFKAFLKAIQDGETEIKDKEGNTIDINYSSINLELYKKDKFLTELHTPFSAETMKLILIMMGLIALCIIAIVLIVFFNKNRTVSIQQIEETKTLFFPFMFLGKKIWQKIIKK